MEKTFDIQIINGDRFKVFIIVNGIQESNTFMPDATAQDILAWRDERVAYYQSIEVRRNELLEQLNNLDAQG